MGRAATAAPALPDFTDSNRPRHEFHPQFPIHLFPYYFRCWFQLKLAFLEWFCDCCIPSLVVATRWLSHHFCFHSFQCGNVAGIISSPFSPPPPPPDLYVEWIIIIWDFFVYPDHFFFFPFSFFNLEFIYTIVCLWFFFVRVFIFCWANINHLFFMLIDCPFYFCRVAWVNWVVDFIWFGVWFDCG